MLAGARTTPLPAVTGLTPVLTPPVLTAAATPVETVLVPAATPAATKQTIKDLLMDKHTPTLTPVETILDPADTTVPAVAVSGKALITANSCNCSMGLATADTTNKLTGMRLAEGTSSCRNFMPFFPVQCQIQQERL